MSGYRAVLLVLFVVGGSLTALPVAATDDANVGSVEPPTAADAGVQQSDAANDSTNRSLGADISSFMQSNAAEADGAVETGMWDAAFNATENRSKQQRLVERRTDELSAELTDLRNRKEELMAERENGTISNATYKARVGQLMGSINALQSAINATETRAEQTDTNVDAVRMLETEARNLSGPEIAAVARNTSGLGNANGTPASVGNGNGTPFQDANDSTGNGVADPANRTSGGPPDDVGNENAADRPDAANGSVSEGLNAGLGPGLEDDRGPSSDGGPPVERGPTGAPPDAENRSVDGIAPNASTPATTGVLGDGTLATAVSASAFGLVRAPPVA